ncbi:hypothetical protein BDY19DRAFT_89397 [Irpex rosettiformis]|uniref:Uncharacterized protein n=1 Tax=Irpex rosettiformis TaxID=378272 RepID=A0ACB8U6N0_9APHY|nr:hypothetical protein BDY19DRAFT_89397 [Irpex rosettiformis]
MESFINVDGFWDLPQHPSTFSSLPEDDFLALLQKQFPSSNNIFDISPSDGVDPLNINPLGIPNPTPPSTDSSPSPPSVPHEPASSRPQSGVFNVDGANSSKANEDSSLKRKASDESMNDESMQKDGSAGPSSDPASKRPASGPHRRKSTGHPHQDETRLLKRKEQNRAAQRAFRERKEKHVKDLEDKVAALEAKNQLANSENDNLRDLLSRLQSENMALKQASFTFNVPKPNNAASPPVFPSPQQHIFSSPGASTSTSASSPVGQILQPQSYDVNFASLIPFDPASLSVIDEPTATDSAMNMDYGFGQPNGLSPYKTIASNPMYMSFAEPTPYDLSPPPLHPLLQTSLPADSNALQSFSSWATSNSAPSPGRTAFESLFGGFHGSQPSVDFQALLESPPSAVSPVSHGGVRSNPSSPPALSNNGPEPTHNPILPKGHDKCPKTKEEVSRMIQQQGQSAFVESPSAQVPAQTSLYQPTNGSLADSCTMLTADSLMANTEKSPAAQSSQSEETVVGPNGGFVKKMSDGAGSIVMCKGSSFPKTEKSERNIEVLTAWRTITSNPQFKNVDINDLCSEFTKKARCDGTKVVLEPESVSCIIERLGKSQ